MGAPFLDALKARMSGVGGSPAHSYGGGTGWSFKLPSDPSHFLRDVLRLSWHLELIAEDAMLLVELRKPECSTEQDNKNACGDMKMDKRELFSFGLH